MNSGCRFDDAGRPLPKVRLGAPVPLPDSVVVDPIALGDLKQVRLEGGMHSYPNGCSDEPLGAVFGLTLDRAKVVDVSVQSAQQVSLALLKTDALGERRLVECLRGFSPFLDSLSLLKGSWEFAITGKGKVNFNVSESNVKKAFLMDAEGAGVALALKPSDRTALGFMNQKGDGYDSLCGSGWRSFRLRVKLNQELRLSLTPPKGLDGVQIGLKAVGDAQAFCAPPINQNFRHVAEEGAYDLIVETSLPINKLNSLPWILNVD